MVGEFDFLAHLRARLPTGPTGQVWAGDDAAVLAGGLLAATDMLVDDVHFRRNECGARAVGWKAIAVNVSDIAAMGGTPFAVLGAVALPRGANLADELLEGMAEAADAFGCPLVGGDVTSGPVLVCSVAVLGRAADSGAVLRSGAHVGDTVFVTGTLGGPAAARHALDRGAAPHPDGRARLDRPIPRVREGVAAAAAGATAMIDVSDGFAADLGHICDESGVGVRIDECALPAGPGASAAEVIGGGDDYELVFTAPDPARVAAAFGAAGCEPPAAVGVVAERERIVDGADGVQRGLDGAGWEHQI